MGRSSIYTDRTPNARYGRITVRMYPGFNVLLLVGICGGMWFLAARADSHGIPPNTNPGFRSQHTLVSLHGWYVAQRVGSHFAAIATTTIVTVAVLTVVALAYVRRLNPMWIFIVPVVGMIAVAVCFVVAGHHADRAAITVEKPPTMGPNPFDGYQWCRCGNWVRKS